MTETWRETFNSLRFAFQPIARSSDARAYGYEALLRGWEEAGFRSIASVFDAAFLDEVLLELDLRLRARAFSDFSAWAPAGSKLFYNMDNRIFLAADDAMDDTLTVAAGFGLSASRIVLEISERHELEGDLGFERAIARYREAGFRIAIDDFGSGYAGLKLLQMSEPDVIKIDRHFVAGTGAEPQKAAFLEKIVGMAHLMGVPVVAEGVELESELSVCVESGCDMIQGYLLARPLCGADGFASYFPMLSEPNAEARRGRSRSASIASSSIRRIAPVKASSSYLQILDRFRKESDLDVLPVVDEAGEPVGVYLERDFRQYVYSPYGISILEHLGAAAVNSPFLRKAPIAASSADLGRVLEVFGSLPNSGGVILARDSRYDGVLPASELLSLVAERDLSEARDQNPLTRLPGNVRIAEVIAQRLAEGERSRCFCYFDFDDFKPFNDRYGFRLGDRVIQLFADMLKTSYAGQGSFVGHLGGDDFFSFSFSDSPDAALELALSIVERFRREASSFYSPEDRDRGWILGRDRSGEERRMPLIGVSAALAFLVAGARLDAESLSDLFAVLKKDAKADSSHIAYRAIEAGAAGEERERRTCPREGPAFAVFTPKLRFF